MAAPMDLGNAVAQGDSAVVWRLLSQGVDINRPSRDGMTPLGIASFWGYNSMVDLLLDNGADVNAQNQGTRWTPLHCAAFQGHGPVILRLMQHNPDVTLKDSSSRTAADFASASDSIWPFFAAKRCRRTPKSTLLQLGISQNDDIPEDYSGSNRDFTSQYGNSQGIQMQERDPQMEYAAASGDVLAYEDMSSNSSSNRQFLRVYDN